MRHPLLTLLHKETSAKLLRLAVALVAATMLTTTAFAQESDRYDGPIIDMHMHAFSLWYGSDGNPPPSDCYGEPCNPIYTAARTDEDLIRLTVEEMNKNNVVLGMLGGDIDMVSIWTAAVPGRFIGGSRIPRPGEPTVDELRQRFSDGLFDVIGEINSQDNGYAPNDPGLEPYFALAEQLDVPVLIHTLGNGAFNPTFRVAAGNPILLEDVLVKHPKLRLYVENCGFPFSSEMIAMMYQYPTLHCDVSTITWMFPRDAFLDHFERLIRAGLHKRIMFGSDQVIWPESISVAIETIQSVAFLTPRQRADIFYDNAARFLRLSDEEIARHHRE